MCSSHANAYTLNNTFRRAGRCVVMCTVEGCRQAIIYVHYTYYYIVFNPPQTFPFFPKVHA